MSAAVATEAVVTAPKATKTKKVATKPGAPKPKPAHPSYFSMIVEAIRNLKESNGSSRQAILKFIVSKHNVDAKLAVTRARIELKKALANGKIKHGKS
jgi:histone H1/5